jgi:hypothetical protein
MGDKVESRSDHAYPGYPVAFYWQGLRLEVTKIISEEQHPWGYSFQAWNETLGIFELNFDIDTDQWSVEQR